MTAYIIFAFLMGLSIGILLTGLVISEWVKTLQHALFNGSILDSENWEWFDDGRRLHIKRRRN